MLSENEIYNAGYEDGVADERERIAQAIEEHGKSYQQPSPTNLSHWFDIAASIARGNNDLLTTN